MTVALPVGATLASLVARFGGEVADEVGARVVRRLATPWERELRADDLVPVLRARAAPLVATGPSVALASPAIAARLDGRAVWTHEQPARVIAGLLADVAPAPPPDERTRALVEPGASVSPTARIGAFAVIRAGAVVGDGCRVGAHAVLHGGVVLGARVVVGDGAVLGAPGFGWLFDERGATRVPQLGGVAVGDDVEIGAHATVDAGTIGPTTIGRGAKLDAHVHVGHNAAIGAGTVVAAQAGFAGSARVGERVLVGGQVGVADHVEVGDDARLAAKAGVIGDVPARATYAGYPAMPRASWLRFHAGARRRLAGDAVVGRDVFSGVNGQRAVGGDADPVVAERRTRRPRHRDPAGVEVRRVAVAVNARGRHLSVLRHVALLVRADRAHRVDSAVVSRDDQRRARHPAQPGQIACAARGPRSGRFALPRGVVAGHAHARGAHDLQKRAAARHRRTHRIRSAASFPNIVADAGRRARRGARNPR